MKHLCKSSELCVCSRWHRILEHTRLQSLGKFKKIGFTKIIILIAFLYCYRQKRKMYLFLEFYQRVMK
jgi:hypothetical protein